MSVKGNPFQAFTSFLRDRLAGKDEVSVIPAYAFHWNVATVINRLSEELSVKDHVVLTRRETADEVLAILTKYPIPQEIGVHVDSAIAGSLLRDSIFENLFLMDALIASIEGIVKHIYIDLSATHGSFSLIAKNIEGKHGGVQFTYTHVDAIPLPNLPQYPMSPKWIHKVYVHSGYVSSKASEPGVAGEADNGPLREVIPWSTSKGIFERLSRILNSVANAKLMEMLVEGKREEVAGNHRIDIYAISPYTKERKRFITVNSRDGPDEEVVNQMMSSWKIITEIISRSAPDIDEQVIERILMQYQRYTGSVDIIVREIEGKLLGVRDYEGWKLHSLFTELYRRTKKPIAVLPDTNMFYQGLHLVFLKTSIKNGIPWTPIEGIRPYIPICAEAEINSRIAKSSADASGLSKYYYIMALLAHRALNEVKLNYRANPLPAVSQPCEASIAVEQKLPEDLVVLVTADKKAYNAWKTLDVCKDRAICIYAGHRNKPLNIDGLFSKLYASVVLTQQIYVASSFVPLEISSNNRRLLVSATSLSGHDAPVVSVNEVLGALQP